MYYRSLCLSLSAVAALAPSLLCQPAFASTLAVDTSRPESSTFVPGEKVTATFVATGLSPNSSSVMSIVIKDEHEAVLTKTTLQVQADAAGNWRGDWTAPSDKLGFYRVFPALADGTALPKLASRAAGYFTYAVVPDPLKRTDYGSEGSVFGMQGGFNVNVKVIPYLGVRWVLGGFGWGNMEKDHPGQLAEDVAKAKAAGKIYPPPSTAVQQITYMGKPWNTYLLPGLNGVPAWALVPGSQGSAQGAILPTAEGSWASYTEQVGKTFSSLAPNYPRRYYQVTWEPVYPWGFKGTDEQLVRIYQLAYPALHKGDPHAMVVGPTDGGIGDGDAAWTERLMKAGIGKYLDGLSIHPYFPLPPEQNGLIEHVDALKAVIRQYVGHDLPLLGTEQGYATGEDETKELLQADGLVRENLILIGEGFKLNFAFYVHDYPGEPGYGFYYNLNPRASFGTDKTGPKPVVPAYAAMTYLIDGHKPTQRIDYLGATSLGYAFERGDDVVLALWDFGSKAHTVSLPVGKAPVKVYDMMGNERVVAPSNGQIDVTISNDPIYIKGVAPAIWGSKARKPLVLAATRLNVFPGQKAVIKGTAASSDGKTYPGSVTVTPDPQIAAAPIIKAGKLGATPVPISLSFDIPADLPVGRYMTRVALQQNGQSIAAGGVLLNVQAPIAVSDIHPSFAGGKPGLSARLTNLTHAAIAADASVRIAGLPGQRPTLHLKFAPTQSQLVTFDVSDLSPSNDHNYETSIALTTETGYKSSTDVSVAFENVPRVGAPPAPDSKLSEWPGDAMSISGRSRVVRSPQYYNGVLSANVKLAWDASNLYLAFDVTDPTYYQPFTGFDTWRGDCLQVEFNLDPGKKAANSGNAVADAGSVRNCEIDFALTKNGPEAYRTMSFSPEKLPVRQLTASEAKVNVVNTGGGLRYRIAVPWTTLGLTTPPAVGQRLGFAATINDANNAAQLDPTALGLFVDSNTKDPSKFGEVVLTRE